MLQLQGLFDVQIVLQVTVVRKGYSLVLRELLMTFLTENTGIEWEVQQAGQHGYSITK